MAETLGARNEAPMLGDIVLAAGVCAREAAEKDVTVEIHAAHLVVHGTLHLLGYDHETGDAEAEEMEEIERRRARLARHRGSLCGDRGRILDPWKTTVRASARKGAVSGEAFGTSSSATMARPRSATRSRRRSRIARARSRAVGDLSHVERADAAQHSSFRREDRRRRRRAARRHHRGAGRRSSFEALVAAFAEAGHSRMPVYRGQPRHGDRHDPRQGRLRHAVPAAAPSPTTYAS